MARNMSEESEFGLGLMPILTPDGDVVDGGSGATGLPAANGDTTSLKNGGDQDLGTQLRAIYATDPDRLPQ